MSVAPRSSSTTRRAGGRVGGSTRPDGRTPTASDAATAASALIRWWRAVKASSRSSRSPCATTVVAVQPHVAAVAEAHDLETAQVRLEQRLARGHDGRRHAASSSALARATPSSDPTCSRWTGADVRDDADVRLADGGEVGDLAEAAHGRLEHQHLGPGRRGEDLQRHADVGVEVRARGDDAPVGGEQRRDQLLGGGLADRAGDRDHPGAELAPPRSRRGARAPPAGRRRRARRRRTARRPRPARRARPRRPPPAPRARTRRRPTRVPTRPTNRSPGPTSRESMTTRRGSPPASPTSRAPAASAIQEAPPLTSAAPRAPPPRRRTAPCGRPRTPGPARGPCRR